MSTATKILLTVALVQAAVLTAGSFTLFGALDERDWLRQEYLAQQGIARDSTNEAEALRAVALAYQDEIQALRAEQRQFRYEAYIRRVNPDAPAAEIVAAVLLAEAETGIDASWLLAKIKQESYFDPQAVSRTGCRGLAQLCRAAMKDVGLDEARVFEVEANVLAGAHYLRMQLARTRGDMARALVRYNGNDDPEFVRRIERHRARLMQVAG